jgi:hypothetical protein
MSSYPMMKMSKTVPLLFIFLFLFFSLAEAFPLDMTLNLWVKGTFPADHYVNIVQISTPYGDGISVNTIGYPGAFDIYYDFFAYYNEVFVVPPSGTVEVRGYFYYNDTTPHLDRKYLALYLLRSDLSGYIVNATHILDYAYGDKPGVWYYRTKVISGLTPGQEYLIAFGRGDLCDMDRRLEASWAAVDANAHGHVIKVPSQYSTIEQAIAEAFPGDVIEVASGIYYEHISIDKEGLKIIGEDCNSTIIDAKKEGVSIGAVVIIIAKNVLLSGFTIQNCPNGDGVTVYGENATIIENNIRNNTVGIRLLAKDCKIARNNVYRNLQGVWMESDVENCVFYFNNFFNNTLHVYHQSPCQGLNSWDNGFVGNFWSNYTGMDMNEDGLGDVPYVINENNVDHYPLMNPYMRGDVNYDKKIDMKDIAFVARRFGCTPTEPLWNFHADINEDGKIDMKDISITARNFGKTWTYP